MTIVGIDEVGRGCWAGPLVAGATILQEPLAGLKDSKLLSKGERERIPSYTATGRSNRFGVGRRSYC